MRVLVTWGSKRGGTEGIGRTLGEALEKHGFEVVAASVDEIRAIDSFDAVIIGGALYGNRWLGKARSFVNRHLKELRKLPVWFFSSGPLDGSADQAAIPAVPEVVTLAGSVGAKGHVTFGGRLEPAAKGFPASAMAKTKSGDWRNPGRIGNWAAQLAVLLPTATPGQPIEYPARSLSRLLMHAGAGWALCAAVMALLMKLVSLTAALVIHGIAAPVIFAVIAWHYFRAKGARDPLPAAASWTMTVILLDVIVAAGVQRSFAMFGSIAGAWAPFGLIFLVTWVIGEVMLMLPAPSSVARK